VTIQKKKENLIEKMKINHGNKIERYGKSKSNRLEID